MSKESIARRVAALEVEFGLAGPIKEALDALDHLAGFHDYYRQPRQATKYRAEAAALRKSMAKVTA